MVEQRAALRASLGPVGVWSFALQGRRVAEAQAAIRAWEDLGYPATWFPESLGSREALSHAALLLAGSRRMIVGSGIASIHARDPMATANGARTLSELYPGRFVLGLGVSHAPAVTARGGTYGHPVAQMAAYLDAVEAAAWTGPAEAGLPPILLAALGPRMLELAAARTAGAHPYFVPVEHTALARRLVGPEPLLVVEQTAVMDADRTRALETARAFAARHLASANYAANLRRLGWTDEDLAGGGSERLLAALVVQGDAAAIAARVREHLDAGADHVCVQLRAPDPADPAVEAYAALRDALGGLVRGPAAG